MWYWLYNSILEKSALKKSVFLHEPCYLEGGMFLVQQGGTEGSPGSTAALRVERESRQCYQESRVDPLHPKILHLGIHLILASAKPLIKRFGKKFWKVSKCKTWSLSQCTYPYQVHTGRVFCGTISGTASRQCRKGSACKEGSAVEPSCSLLWDPGINSQGPPQVCSRLCAHSMLTFMQGTWVSMGFDILGLSKNGVHRYWGVQLSPICPLNWTKGEVWVPRGDYIGRSLSSFCVWMGSLVWGAYILYLMNDCVWMCVCLCLWVCLCVNMCVSICLSMSICVSMCVLLRSYCRWSCNPSWWQSHELDGEVLLGEEQREGISARVALPEWAAGDGQEQGESKGVRKLQGDHRGWPFGDRE